MNISPVSLPQMLDARESRLYRQQRLLSEFKSPLVCVTMNIAGDIKDTPAVRFAFTEAVSSLSRTLEGILHYEQTGGVTGPEAFFVCSAPAEKLKDVSVALEEKNGVGRLYDIDVIGTDGEKLSRGGTGRLCIVCGGPVSLCSRSRAHGLDAIKAATNARLADHISAKLAGDAVCALYEEVHVTPKPGLVDENNSGAHDDMDVALFEKSADALLPFFEEAVLTGTRKRDCFWELNRLGIEAEAAMFGVTGGVNTHKGALYSFLILLGACGAVLFNGGDLFETAAEISRGDTRPTDMSTNGGGVFEKYGVSGARGEALSGFSHAKSAAQRLISGETPVRTLLGIIADTDDTNVLHRAGKSGLEFLREGAEKALMSEDENAVFDLDTECIRRRISPGGCADILAMSLYLAKIRPLWRDEYGKI